MKAFLVLACLAVFAAANTTPEWHGFKAAHNKSYKNLIEERLRMRIFQDNVKAIEAHNAKFEKGEVSYKKAINQFADMTGAEFLAFLKLSGTSKKHQSGVVHKSVAAAPVSADWREKGAVTPVKDQGSCGSCWSFSATGSVEGQNQLKNGKLVSLSEQQLMDCSTAYGNMGCNGGLMDSAFEYLIKYGSESEADYPYEGVDGRCRYDASKVVVNVNDYVDISEDDEDELINAIGTVGPVSVAIDATMELQFYSSGVFDDRTCSKNALNHGVLAVGYTDDTIIVKNSWGTSWGESGYVSFVRGKNLCGIATMASYPTL